MSNARGHSAAAGPDRGVGILQRRHGPVGAVVAAATAACVLGMAPAALAASLQGYQSQERAVQAELSAAQQTYNAAMRALSGAVVRLDRADVALHQGADHLSTVTGQLQQAAQVLGQRQADVTAQEAAVAKDKGVADQGLLTIQQHGSVSFLSVLMGASSFGDFLTRLTLLQKIWGVEVGHLQQARSDEARLQVLEQQQQQAVATLGSLQSQAQTQVRQLQTYQVQAAQAHADAQRASAQAAGAVDQLIAQRNGLQAQIERILADIRSGSVSWSKVLADIQQIAAQYGISPALVEAVVLQESGGNAEVRSSAGAVGLMQLMPGTARALGVDPYNPVQNLEGGITYLLEMLKEFHGNLSLALAAYNAGPNAVKRYGGIPPYTQTQQYVRNVEALYNQGK